MTTIKATGEKVTETREELAKRYFAPLSEMYGNNMGIVSLLSDIQEHISLGIPFSERDKVSYRTLLNDIKCVLIHDDELKRAGK